MAVRKEPQWDQRLIQELGRKVGASLQVKKRSVWTAGKEVNDLLVLYPPLVKEAWI